MCLNSRGLNNIILLVACYELGRPPWSIALLLALLKRAGLQASVLDLSVETLDESRVRSATHVVFAVPMHTALRIGVEAAGRVRVLQPQAKIAFYGHYAQLNRQFLLGELADFVLAGECEEALVDWLRGLPNVAQDPILRSASFVVPDRSHLPSLDRYARLLSGQEQRLAGYVEASRGCKHRCRHCPITPVYEGRFFAVPADVVQRDIAQQVALGAQHITFGDPDFLNGPTHALRVAKALHAAFPEVTFDATAKVEHIVRAGEAYFGELRALGLVFLVTAVESLSDLVLQILDKGHTRVDVERALAILDATSVAMRPSFVPFTPWETLAGYREILDWVRAHDLLEQVDPVQYAIRLLLPPGSPLLDQPAMQPYVVGPDPEHFTVRWKHPDPQMDELCRRVSDLVEHAAIEQQTHRDTFERVCELVGGTSRVDAKKRRALAPRLSEPWFC